MQRPISYPGEMIASEKFVFSGSSFWVLFRRYPISGCLRKSPWSLHVSKEIPCDYFLTNFFLTTLTWSCSVVAATQSTKCRCIVHFTHINKHLIAIAFFCQNLSGAALLLPVARLLLQCDSFHRRWHRPL